MPVASPAALSPIRAVALAALLALSACGGGGGSTATPTTDGEGGGQQPSVAASFPVGLAIGSPGDLAGTGATSAGRVQAQALARAAGAGSPGLLEAAALIARVLDGDTSVRLSSVLHFAALFGAGGHDAGCYGPTLQYASHQDAGGGPDAGTLPSGDVGLWQAMDADSGLPCAVAQIDRRIDGAKAQGVQALLVAALMRGTVARSTTLAMPAAGASTDLTSDLSAVLSAAMPASPATVETATIALDSGGQYTYRLVLAAGSGVNARRGEMILRHTPGATDDVYGGTLQVAGFTLENDPAFGCDDEVDAGTGAFKVARVSSLVYQRDGSTVSFGSRSAQYCGHPDTGTGSDHAAQVAGFTSDHQLDSADQLTGSTRGGATGWRGNFTRYAARYDKDSGAGNFLLAWQAGTGDSHSRAMAATAGAASGGARSVQAWYAFADEIAATGGALLGLICNWAGPGHQHVPTLSFQSQAATLTGGTWTLDSSLITYAPTVSCSSTTTSYDADGDGTLASGEGVGTAAALDGLGGSATTVEAELASRGFTVPALF